MTEGQKKLLSLVYTYGGAPVEVCNTQVVDDLRFLEGRALVNSSMDIWGESFWVTPARLSLNWELETQRTR